MQIRLSPEREAALTALAQERGRDPSELADEAVARFLADQAWVDETRTRIEEGWRQSELGQVVDGEESRRRLDARHADRLARPQR